MIGAIFYCWKALFMLPLPCQKTPHLLMFLVCSLTLMSFGRLCFYEDTLAHCGEDSPQTLPNRTTTSSYLTTYLIRDCRITTKFPSYSTSFANNSYLLFVIPWVSFTCLHCWCCKLCHAMWTSMCCHHVTMWAPSWPSNPLMCSILVGFACSVFRRTTHILPISCSTQSSVRCSCLTPR